MLRRLLLPAILAVPLWHWAMILMIRPATFEWGAMTVADMAAGTLFNCIGILLVCLPMARPIGAWQLNASLKFAAFVAASAVGGFLILAFLALGASLLNRYDPFDIRAGFFGVLGLLPGAITAAVWFAINRDIFYPRKDAFLA